MEPQAETTPNVTPEHYLVRSPFLAWRIIEGEAVVISPQERELHNLNEVATDIWRMADRQPHAEADHAGAEPNIRNRA
jgi:hypothetical protein